MEGEISAFFQVPRTFSCIWRHQEGGWGCSEIFDLEGRIVQGSEETWNMSKIKINHNFLEFVSAGLVENSFIMIDYGKTSRYSLRIIKNHFIFMPLGFRVRVARSFPCGCGLVNIFLKRLNFGLGICSRQVAEHHASSNSNLEKFLGRAKK